MDQLRISLTDWRKLAEEILDEDAASKDITTNLLISEAAKIEAEIIAEGEYVLAGLPGAIECFKILDSDAVFEIFLEEGKKTKAGSTVLKVKGKARSILSAERSALNLLSHLSGIATETYAFVSEAKKYGIEVYDTRKTRPLLRLFEKYAASVGGSKNHRKTLADAVFIKDNHKKILGGMKNVVEKLKEVKLPEGIPLIIEVETIDEIALIYELKPDLVILDNFDLESVKKAVSIFGGKLLIEVSGGVSIDKIPELAEAGVKRISTSSTIMKARAASFKLEVA